MVLVQNNILSKVQHNQLKKLRTKLEHHFRFKIIHNLEDRYSFTPI